jgi:methionyl-tRNA synthetase
MIVSLLLFWISFVLAFLLFVLLFGFFEKRKRYKRYCEECKEIRRGKYCEVCGKRNIMLEEKYPRCWHCGEIFLRTPKYCWKCGFYQGG